MANIPVIQVPTSITGTGTSSRASLLDSHIFGAGLEQPEILRELIIKYPQFWWSELLESVPGSSNEVELESEVYSWQILERTRKGATVSSVANGTTATATLTLDITAASPDLGYFLVGDVIRVANSGENGRVTAVAIAGGFQTIDVVRYAGGNWSTTLVTSAHKIGHIGTNFGKGSSGSGGTRVSLPTYDYNAMQIHRRGYVIEGTAVAQKTYVDDQSWIFNQEMIEAKEFKRDFQNMFMFGKRALDRTGVSQGRGLIEYVEQGGQNLTFSESVGVQESDYVQVTEALLNQNGSEDLVCLMGSRIFLQTQQALADRYRTIPTNAVPQQLAGLGFESYQIGGKKYHFKHLDQFDDQAVVPTVTPSSIAKDFKNVALILDMGTVTSGERNIQVKYRKGRKFIQKFITGMASESHEVSNAYDGFQAEMLSEFMPVVLLPNRCALLSSL